MNDKPSSLNSNLNPEASTQEAYASGSQGFDQLAEGLKAAIAEFDRDQSPENLARIVSALSSFGVSGADLWRKFADFARRHPVQVAAVAGVLFFAYKGLMKDPRGAQAKLH